MLAVRPGAPHRVNAVPAGQRIALAGLRRRGAGAAQPSWPLSEPAKLPETFGGDGGGRDTRRCAFAYQCRHGCGEGGPERLRLQCAGERFRKLGKRLRRQVIVTTSLHGNNTAAQTGKRERVITNGTQVMLGLAKTAPLDAGTGVQRIDGNPSRKCHPRPLA